MLLIDQGFYILLTQSSWSSAESLRLVRDSEQLKAEEGEEKKLLLLLLLMMMMMMMVIVMKLVMLMMLLEAVVRQLQQLQGCRQDVSKML